jgi:hypothetical protein
MNRTCGLLLIFAIFISVPHFAHGQDYYPLKTGNEWFYRSVNLPPADSTITSSIRVMGDSLLSNGKRYFVLRDNDIVGSRFIRKDSSRIYYINPYTGQDQLVFRLDGQLGDTVNIGWGPFLHTRLVAIDTLIILAVRARILTFELEGSLYAVVKLADKFGPMTEWRYSDPPPPWPEWGRELVGCNIDGIRYGHTLDVSEGPSAPKSFDLYQNYPNPFNPSTTIRYELPRASHVRLSVFNTLGQEVATLLDEFQAPGYKSVQIDGSRLSSGVYFYRIQAGDIVQAKKLMLAK